MKKRQNKKIVTTQVRKFPRYVWTAGTYVRKIHGPIGVEKERYEAQNAIIRFRHMKSLVSGILLMFAVLSATAQTDWMVYSYKQDNSVVAFSQDTILTFNRADSTFQWYCGDTTILNMTTGTLYPGEGTFTFERMSGISKLTVHYPTHFGVSITEVHTFDNQNAKPVVIHGSQYDVQDCILGYELPKEVRGLSKPFSVVKRQ